MLKKKKAKKATSKKQRVEVKDLAPEELAKVSGGIALTSTTVSCKTPECGLAVKDPSVTVKPKLIVVY